MKQMMTELNASIQGLAAEMRASIQGLTQRFDGLEGRFDGLENRFNRLAMEFVNARHELRGDFQKAVEEMKGIYRHTAWAAEAAKVSADKAVSHGPMLIDHEDRIRALEGKRKTPPSV